MLIRQCIHCIAWYGKAIPIWGIFPAALLYAVMQCMNYLASRYLNEYAPSDQRATVLSFRGLTTNLAYGGVSLLYSALIASNSNSTFDLVNCNSKNKPVTSYHHCHSHLTTSPTSRYWLNKPNIIILHKHPLIKYKNNANILSMRLSLQSPTIQNIWGAYLGGNHVLVGLNWCCW